MTRLERRIHNAIINYLINGSPYVANVDIIDGVLTITKDNAIIRNIRVTRSPQ